MVWGCKFDATESATPPTIYLKNRCDYGAWPNYRNNIKNKCKTFSNGALKLFSHKMQANTFFAFDSLLDDEVTHAN